MALANELPVADVRRVLALRDLTDRCGGHHAIQDLIDAIATGVSHADTVLCVQRGNPVVPVADNYDRLGYEPDAAARDARYSRYLTRDLMLRSHTSAMVPLALERLSCDPEPDVTLLCPGMVYRRDVIDRQHVGEPHQIDVWRIQPDGHLDEEDLAELIGSVLDAALPGRRWRQIPAEHPYTQSGRQIDVVHDGGWVEVGECGLADPQVLSRAGLPDTATGLASGWGLDRLLMLRKGIDDIRLLRSADPRVQQQMHDLEPYQEVSTMPPAIRDLSVAVDRPLDPELLGDELRDVLGEAAADVESVEVLATTPGNEVPAHARDRLGMRQDQYNVLVRVVLRALDRTLTAEQANHLRDRIYAEIHNGTVHQWAHGDPSAATGRLATASRELP